MNIELKASDIENVLREAAKTHRTRAEYTYLDDDEKEAHLEGARKLDDIADLLAFV